MFSVVLVLVVVFQHHLHSNRQQKSNHNQYQHHKNQPIHHHHQKHYRHRHCNIKPKNHQLQKQKVVTLQNLRLSNLSSFVGARTDKLPLPHLHPATPTLGILSQGSTSGTATTNSSSQGPRCGVITGGDFSKLKVQR